MQVTQYLVAKAGYWSQWRNWHIS